MALIQVAQHAADLERAAAFYERLLGRPASALFDPPGLLFFDLGGVRLLLEKAAPSAVLYLQVDHLDATWAQLEASGVQLLTPPHLIFTHHDDTLGPAGAEEWQAFITDSEGNTVGLVEHRSTGTNSRDS